MADFQWRSVGKEFHKFVLIGAFSTALNYCVFLLCFELGGGYIPSMAIGFLAGTVVGYQLNKRWTFGVTEASRSMFANYVVLYSVSMLCGMAFLTGLVESFGLDVRIGNLLTIGLTTCINFVGLKFVIFGGKNG